MKKTALEGITIYQAAERIQNGWLVLPLFREQYGWNINQMEKLVDSVLCNYPIGAFNFWELSEENGSEEITFATFPKDFVFTRKDEVIDAFHGAEQTDFPQTDVSVLDGAWRLYAFYLALYGNVLQKTEDGETVPCGLFVELDHAKLDPKELDGKKFGIAYRKKDASLSPTAFEMRRMLDSDFTNPLTRDAAFAKALEQVPKESKAYAVGVLNKVYNQLYVEKRIHFTSFSQLQEEDARELFKRINARSIAI